MYISIPYMIRFDVQKDAANLRSFFLAFLLQFLLSVLLAEQRLGMYCYVALLPLFKMQSLLN